MKFDVLQFFLLFVLPENSIENEIFWRKPCFAAFICFKMATHAQARQDRKLGPVYETYFFTLLTPL